MPHDINDLQDSPEESSFSEHSRFSPEFPRLTENDLEDLHISNNSLVRIIYITIGLTSLALGIIGIILPVLPTTPFILLSAYCFARSNARLYLWLLNHRFFGRPLRNYRKYKVIPLPAKLAATGLIIVSITTSIIFFIPIFYVQIGVACIATCVIFYIWSHSSEIPQESNTEFDVNISLDPNNLREAPNNAQDTEP